MLQKHATAIHGRGHDGGEEATYLEYMYSNLDRPSSYPSELIIPQCLKSQTDKVKFISIVYLTLIHSAVMRSSRSAAVEELLAAPHKKELFFLFFLEEQKRKEVHVQCSLGRAIWWRKEEERGKKKPGRWSEKGTALLLHLWKTSSIVAICLQLFGGIYLTAVISSSSIGLSVFLFSSEG